jgi:hypothetical protein
MLVPNAQTPHNSYGQIGASCPRGANVSRMVRPRRPMMLFHHTYPRETTPMHYCEQCARSVEPVEPNRSSQICPRCGAPLKLVQQDGWINVARLTSLAEAGFLADELMNEDLEARIYAAESFSVLTDRWTPSYLIQVPAESVHEAAAAIRRRLSEEPFIDQEYDDDRPDPVHWRPAALVLVAGAMCFVLGQQFGRQLDRHRPAAPNSLSAIVGAIGRPMLTEPAPGQPRYRLMYQRREQTWYLDTDADGDGRYESRREFHASGGG